MAACIAFDRIKNGLTALPSVDGGYTHAAWFVSDAVFTAGEYSCPTGAHLLMTVAEVNAMPKTGVPDAALMRESFFMSFGLVLSCYLLGKLAGAVLHVIRRG